MATDIAAEFEQLNTNYNNALEAWRTEVARANTASEQPDGYLKLQFKAAQDALDKFRSFWRGVDASVYMDDPDYGYPKGAYRGRRGGELALVEEPPGEDS
mgnify:CR=1 FL=1